MLPRLNILKHLLLREVYGHTQIKHKRHYILINRNIDKIPIELLN